MKEAMKKRCSRRSYTKEELRDEDISYLSERIDEINRSAGLHMQLVINNREAFHGLKKSYGMFHNVANYIALIANSRDVYSKEKLGYYGEKLVLEATQRGLGTCWVGGTFSAADCPVTLDEHEELYCVIVVGYVKDQKSMKEQLISKGSRRKSKTIEELCNGQKNIPSWMREGLEAVQIAPSALFKQPVHFKYENDKVYAKVASTEGFEMIDMGIAMLHFELGAENGTWTWGNPATYKVKQ